MTNTTVETRPTTENRTEPRPNVLSATAILGDGVTNRAGEDLGKIEELMIDVAGGQVGYAILSFGGFLGIGDKLFAVPWRALRLNEDRQFILDVDRRRFEEAPGFDRDNWPDMTDPEWGAQVDEFYTANRPW